MIDKESIGCTHEWENFEGEPCACPDCLEREVKRLQEIEDKTPKTANKVPIILGETELWARDDYSSPPRVFRLGVAFALTIGVPPVAPRVMAGGSSWILCSETYSSAEEAEKARLE